MTALRKVVTGEPLQIKAGTWNAFIDAAMYSKQREKSQSSTVMAGVESPNSTVLVQNNSGSALDALSVVAITSPIISASDNESEFKARSGWQVAAPGASDFGKFLLLAESIPSGQMGLAYSGGVVPVKCEVGNTAFDRADVNPGNTTKLLASFHGSSQILWKAGVGTSVWCAVRMGNPQLASVVGKANGDIIAGSMGQVTVWSVGSSTGYVLENVYLDWMHGSENISSGKEVMATWFPHERRWRITGAECE